MSWLSRFLDGWRRAPQPGEGYRVEPSGIENPEPPASPSGAAAFESDLEAFRIRLLRMPWVPVERGAIQAYLDNAIVSYRMLRDTPGQAPDVVERCGHYIDAFQCARESIIGSVLASDRGGRT